MSMQDKDMDQLFRSRLEGLEVEPSERVWKGITVELDGVKKRNTLIPVMRIAATITVIIAVGLFFMLKGNKAGQYQAADRGNVKSHVSGLSAGPAKQGTEDNAPAIAPNQGQEIASTPRTADNNVGEVNERPDAIAEHNNRSVVAKNNLALAAKPSTDENTDALPQKAEPQETLAAITNTKVEVNNPVVPDESLNAPVNSTDIETKGATAPVKAVIAQVTPAQTNKAPTKKHGIRSLGDFINVVVAKVDKRQDKVIEFSDTDGDESTVTGINLGFVKVKKEK